MIASMNTWLNDWQFKSSFLWKTVPTENTSITEYLCGFLARLINTFKPPNPWNVNNSKVFFHGNTFWKMQQKPEAYTDIIGLRDWLHCKLCSTWSFLTTWKNLFREICQRLYILRVDVKCTRSSKVCLVNKLFAAMLPWMCYKM